MTYAERQFAHWEQTRDALLAGSNPRAVPETADPLANVAVKVVDRISAYQPYDFQPGFGWINIMESWLQAPPTTCRSLAIAALTEVIFAIEEYKATAATGLRPQPVDISVPA